jgi:hypothetical protein
MCLGSYLRRWMGEKISPLVCNFVAAILILFLYIETITLKKTLGQYEILHVRFRLILFTNFNAQFLYSLTICMLHYNPRHVSSINMPIFRKTNCVITASGIVTLCKRLHSMPICSAVCSHPAYCIAVYKTSLLPTITRHCD